MCLEGGIKPSGGFAAFAFTEAAKGTQRETGGNIVVESCCRHLAYGHVLIEFDAGQQLAAHGLSDGTILANQCKDDRGVGHDVVGYEMVADMLKEMDERVRLEIGKKWSEMRFCRHAVKQIGFRFF